MALGSNEVSGGLNGSSNKRHTRLGRLVEGEEGSSYTILRVVGK